MATEGKSVRSNIMTDSEVSVKAEEPHTKSNGGGRRLERFFDTNSNTNTSTPRDIGKPRELGG